MASLPPPGRRRRAHGTAALLLLLFAVVVVVEAGRLPRWHPDGSPGPGFVPFWSGLALVGLSLASLVGAVRQGDRPITAPDDLASGPGGAVVATAVALLGYVALIHLLGYALPTVLFIATLLGLYGGYPLQRSALLAGLITLGLVLVFQVWLAIPLPRGIVDFSR